MYKTVETMEHTIEALGNNKLFSLTFERMLEIESDKNSDLKNLSKDECNEIMKGIIEDVPFEEVYERILEVDYLDEPFFGGDIVQCMFPQYNKKAEELDKIYNVVNFKPHENEAPVFFCGYIYNRLTHKWSASYNKRIVQKRERHDFIVCKYAH